MLRIVLSLTVAGLACARAAPPSTVPAPQAPTRQVPTPTPDQPAQLPLDPLTAAERDAAARIAQADARVRELIGGRRSRITSIELIVGKAPADTTADPAPQRNAEVSIHVYDTDSAVRAVVDLSRRIVTEAEGVAGGRAPFDSAEIAEARRLALASPAVRREAATIQSQVGARLEDMQVDWLGIRSTDPQDPCSRSRCVQLLFRRGDVYVADPVIIVNLSAQTVEVTRRNR